MSKVVCVIPGDSVERALQGENILIEDFVQMTRQDFILSTIYLMAEVGFSSLRRANEDLARRMWYNRMEMYNFWDVGMSSEEDVYEVMMDLTEQNRTQNVPEPSTGQLVEQIKDNGGSIDHKENLPAQDSNSGPDVYERPTLEGSAYDFPPLPCNATSCNEPSCMTSLGAMTSSNTSMLMYRPGQ